jgi:hypothetical protein
MQLRFVLGDPEGLQAVRYVALAFFCALLQRPSASCGTGTILDCENPEAERIWRNPDHITEPFAAELLSAARDLVANCERGDPAGAVCLLVELIESINGG